MGVQRPDRGGDRGCESGVTKTTAPLRHHVRSIQAAEGRITWARPACRRRPMRRGASPLRGAATSNDPAGLRSCAQPCGPASPYRVGTLAAARLTSAELTRGSALPITIYGIKNCDTMTKARAWL